MGAEDNRVLLVAPVGQDAKAMAAMLRREGVTAEACAGPGECLECLKAGAGALLLTEEALELPRAEELLESFQRQPAWSELPLIILTSGGESRFERLLEIAAEVVGGAMLLERPMREGTLLRTVQVALRSRQRQYEVRDLMAERERGEAILRESEEQFRTLADSIPTLAWWARADGYITWYNRRWYEYTGTTPEQMEGWGWQSVHDPEMLPRVLERWKLSIATGEQFEMEFPLRGADGRFGWFLTRVMPVKDKGGKVVRWFGLNMDVSEIREAREVLKRDREQLEQLVAERTAALREMVGELEHFSYSITHDMRAPLRAMMGFAEAAKELCSGCEQQEQKGFLDRIQVAARRMDLLITDALNYSKTVRSELPMAPMDVGRLLRGMVDTYPELQAAQGGIRIEPELPLVMGNEAGLTQCFSNLLVNAVKFTKPGEAPEIRVWAELVDSSKLTDRGSASGYPSTTCLATAAINHRLVRIWVEDRGVGIGPKMLPRVFDMFARGASEQAGTGIGLALVRKVVDRMGGRVGVESEAGRGSRFWVELRSGDVRGRAGV